MKKAYQEMSKDELLALKNRLEKDFEDAKGMGLKLDMSRGKPCPSQLVMGMDILDTLTSESDMKALDGVK